jgi:hypothetical protein
LDPHYPMSSVSVLDYARLHGLSVDQAIVPLISGLKQLPLDNEDSFLESDRRLVIDCEQLLQDDKLQIDCGAVSLLATCTRPPGEPDWSEITKQARKAKDLRIEVPMLMSNHSKDMRWFTKRPNLDQLLRQHGHSSNEHGGLKENVPQAFESYEEHSVSLLRDIADERLEVSATALTFLSGCIKKTWSRDAGDAIMERALGRAKVHVDVHYQNGITLADRRSIIGLSSFSHPCSLLTTTWKMPSTVCHLCRCCSWNLSPTLKLMLITC